MKFVREPGSAVTVRHVEQGKIKIGNEELIDNVVLFRDEIRRDWQPADIDNPTSQDLAELIREKPEVIIFGTGWQTRLPPRELVFAESFEPNGPGPYTMHGRSVREAC